MPVGTCISSLGKCLLSPLLMFKLVCYWVVCAVLCLVAQSCPALETPWTVPGQASLSMNIHQARILEEVAMPSTSRFPWSSNWTRSPALQADSSPAELPGELLSCHSLPIVWVLDHYCIYNLKYFPPFCRLPFHIWGSALWYTQVFHFDEVHCAFSFFTHAFLSYLLFTWQVQDFMCLYST